MSLPQLSRRLTTALSRQQADQHVLADRVKTLEETLYWVAEYCLKNANPDSHVHIEKYLEEMENAWLSADSQTELERPARSPSGDGRTTTATSKAR